MKGEMEIPVYVGRVNDEECFEILKDQKQFSIDSDAEILGQSLRRIDLSKLKLARSSFRLMRDFPREAQILFIGTQWWDEENINAKTVIGYGLTLDDRDAYCYVRSHFWRHRLRLKSLELVSTSRHRIDLQDLGIRGTFPPSRLFADRRGVAARVLAKIHGEFRRTLVRKGPQSVTTGRRTSAINSPISVRSDLRKIEKSIAAFGKFSPSNLKEETKRTLTSIVLRRGQPIFRSILIRLYSGRCAISGCDAPEALEAAHIFPYKGPKTNHPSNGLLLRADLHTLFDLGLMTISPTSPPKVILDSSLMQTSYAE